MSTQFVVYLFLLHVFTVQPLTTDDEDEGIGIVSADEEEVPVITDDDDRTLKEASSYQRTMTNLEKKLFGTDRYNNYWLPPWGNSKTVVLRMRFFLHSINHVSINQTDQTMKINGRICSVWYDPNYSWDPSKFDGVYKLSIRRWDIWTPDFRVLNGINGLMGIWAISNNDLKLYNAVNVGVFGVIDCLIDEDQWPSRVHHLSFTWAAISMPLIILMIRMYAAFQLPILGTRSWFFIRNLDLEGFENGAGQETELSTYLRYAVTRKNETKPNVADFTITKISSKIVYQNHEGKIIPKRTGPRDISFAQNEVHFVRYAPYFFHTIVLPSIAFGMISILAPLATFPQASLLLLTNLALLAIYMRDLIDELPKNFSSFPRIVWYWIIQMIFSFFQLTRIFIEETRRIERREEIRWLKIQEWTKQPLHRRLLTIDSVMAFISLLAMFILLP